MYTYNVSNVLILSLTSVLILIVSFISLSTHKYVLLFFTDNLCNVLVVV